MFNLNFIAWVSSSYSFYYWSLKISSITFISDYTDSNENESKADIGFKVRLQCARKGTLEKPVATGERPCDQVGPAEAFMGAIEGIAYMIGSMIHLAAFDY